jgi:hypothetical protein
LTPLRQRCFYPLAIEQVPGAGVLLLDETNFYRYAGSGEQAAALPFGYV